MKNLLCAVWNGLQTAEFWGAVFGAGVAVMIGIIATKLADHFALEREHRRVRTLLCWEVESNRLAARTFAANSKISSNSIVRGWDLLVQPKPTHSQSARQELARYPGALSPSRSIELMQFYVNLETTTDAWMLFRSARANVVSATQRGAGAEMEQIQKAITAPLWDAIVKINAYAPDWCPIENEGDSLVS